MLERFGEGVSKPTTYNYFRVLVRKVDEIHNCPGEAQRRATRREALGIARYILTSCEDRGGFSDAWGRATLLYPEITREVYQTLLAVKIVKALDLRTLLGIRPHGVIVSPHEGC